MTPEQIRALRKDLNENTAMFGQRFARSGRTVEDWEQGRRIPDPLVLREMEGLRQRLAKKRAR